MEPSSDFDMLGALLQWAILFLIFALVYLVYISYSRLASKHNRTPWQYGIIGIIIFFAGLSLGREIIELINPDPNRTDFVKLAFSFLLFSIGTLISWLAYKILKKRWKAD